MEGEKDIERERDGRRKREEAEPAFGLLLLLFIFCDL